MIINLDWQDFQLRFLRKAEMVYVYKTVTSWTLYTYSGFACLKTVVNKKDEDEQNMMFVDRYLNESNICKVLSVDERLKVGVELSVNDMG